MADNKFKTPFDDSSDASDKEINNIVPSKAGTGNPAGEDHIMDLIEKNNQYNDEIK